MESIDKKMKLVNGQPDKKTKRKSDIAKDYYKLGRLSANVEQQKKETEQNVMLNMTQQVMLNQATQELQKTLLEVTMRQQELEAMMREAIAPPPLAEAGLPMPPGGGPPLEGMDIGGIPPEMLAAGGTGGPPPPSEMGGGIPIDLAGAPPLSPGMM